MTTTPITFHTEDGKCIGTEHFRTGFTTTEVADRCMLYAKLHGQTVEAKRPDGYTCGMGFPDRPDPLAVWRRGGPTVERHAFLSHPHTDLRSDR